jgi:hypothetical protein
MERPAWFGYEAISTRTACSWPLTVSASSTVNVSSGNETAACVVVAGDVMRAQVAAARALWVVAALSLLAYIAWGLRATRISLGADWLTAAQAQMFLCALPVPFVLLMQSVDPMSLGGVLPLYISIGLDQLLPAVVLCQVLLIADLLLTAGTLRAGARRRLHKLALGAAFIVAFFLGSEALAEFGVPASYGVVAGLRATLATGALCVWTFIGVRQVWRIQLQMTDSSTMSAVGTMGRKMRAHSLQQMRVKVNRFYITNVLVGSTMVFTASNNLAALEQSWGFDLSTPAFFLVPNLYRLLFVVYICLAMSFFTVTGRKEGSVRPGSPSYKSTGSFDGVRSPRAGSQASSPATHELTPREPHEL